ncbi:hypothetical protein F1957_01640 [Akkermansia sp. BIOML-A14]|nr:hypothetical protein F2A16_00665 [Akkermansia sp. BIOML-A67]KAA3151324.1 hypothetical protein F1994_01660 [Akkermansia sp. BIOML-A64]KAA3153825.1 hypothetical protein F2A12_06415 [Akkermansia sp. BIOML-A65]KAA3156859.1 hypothetical protein F1995_00665 [Akkermansia sp. BIOML-A62]KAA3164540.1 hypothetical protein F2A01_03855 [Akkermansia sp. BIOML-A60]KAA3166591.1 hypothetical protein F2A23_03525 [Akkermansia sp. BIOML-A63]KAA3170758.1 hypothetical protein F1996_02735 [Akkermansia sp. BIOML-
MPTCGPGSSRPGIPPSLPPCRGQSPPSSAAGSGRTAASPASRARPFHPGKSRIPCRGNR